MSLNKTKQYAKENPQRNVAVVALRDEMKNVLLMRSHKLPWVWQPVGGGIEPEDVSAKSAALRELREELGIILDATSLKDIMEVPYDFGEGTIYFFEATLDSQSMRFSIDSQEVIECRWFSKKEALALPAMPATKKYLSQML